MSRTQQPANSGNGGPGARRAGRGRAARAVSLLLPFVAAAVLMISLATCGSEQVMLLTIRGDAAMTVFSLQVKDLQSNTLILDRQKEPVGAGLDPAAGFKVAVEFDLPGSYLVYIRGFSPNGNQFFIKRYDLDGVVEETVELVTLQSSLDADGDGFPACGSYADKCPPMSCGLFDCDDSDKAINPFAKEVCGDGKDNDCSAGCNAASGAGDIACEDKDKDGVAADKDCDDADPCRAPNLKEEKNLCTTAKDKFPAFSQACLDQLAASGKTYTPPYCGDGLDQDCDGQDDACAVDEDCDGYSPPQDCNDKDKTINPAAQEKCDKVDNNCNDVIDEGCLPCDVDGDTYGSKASKASGTCPPAIVNKADDPDDYDAGIYPGSTGDTGGKEGGALVKTALRQWCSGKLEAKNSTAAKPVYFRDVDHDGDGRAAKADCPDPKCDADGDGFQRYDAAAGCTPSASKTDCDDSDPRTFPDAPDNCKDTKKQNCASNVPCSSDADGDGYVAAQDCNDNDATVHPWAPEICNGVDDDCDDLIDEGNPAAAADALTGKVELLPTYKNACNDSKYGQCATCDPQKDPLCNVNDGLSGICACSQQIPQGYKKNSSGVYTWPTSPRVACTGEDLTASASPRCFGATQPQKERCDQKDHDCDNQPFVKGQDFVGKGNSCSKTVGECKAGTITDCDLTKKVPDYALVKSFDQNYTNDNWICSGVLPRKEVCNGRDDDCDGKLADFDQDNDGTKESSDRDRDVDQHIYCKNGCTYSESRFALATGITSCKDCDETDVAIFPGATEKCDGVDNNCTGDGDEGSAECGPQSKDCCPQKNPPQCVDLKTAFNDCGKCGNACDSLTADRCVGGQCKCGSGSPCKDGLTCNNGVCECIPGTVAKSKCYNGCCVGKTKCLTRGTEQDVNHCGIGGVQCSDCDDSKSCTSDSCSIMGVCGNTNIGDGKKCNDGSGSGTCKGSACCAGCWSGSTCLQGTSIGACGQAGDTCQACTAKDQCHKAVCSTSGNCGNQALTGTSCDDGDPCTVSDTCVAGVCKGTAKSCAGDACNDGYCVPATGACAKKPKAGNPSCTDVAGKTGKCSKGACCSGCLDQSGNCQNGGAVLACGLGGATCATCSTTKACQKPVCSAGVCGEANVTDGLACTGTGGKSGTCTTGVCCTGCVDATGNCQSGLGVTSGTVDLTISLCGGGGITCQTCTSSDPCLDPTCDATSTSPCGTKKKAEGATCEDTGTTGTCHQYTPLGGVAAGFFCCTGCWDGTTCLRGLGQPYCGIAGAECTLCKKTGLHPNGGGTSCVAGVCDCSKGCWDSTGKYCYDGKQDTYCGSGGTTCTDCTATSTTCNAGSQTCQ